MFQKLKLKANQYVRNVFKSSSEMLKPTEMIFVAYLGCERWNYISNAVADFSEKTEMHSLLLNRPVAGLRLQSKDNTLFTVGSLY